MLNFELSLEDRFLVALVERQSSVAPREELEEMLIQVTRLYLAYKRQTETLLKERIKNGF
jgi:hypothetical protein